MQTSTGTIALRGILLCALGAVGLGLTAVQLRGTVKPAEDSTTCCNFANPDCGDGDWTCETGENCQDGKPHYCKKSVDGN